MPIRSVGVVIWRVRDNYIPFLSRILNGRIVRNSRRVGGLRLMRDFKLSSSPWDRCPFGHGSRFGFVICYDDFNFSPSIAPVDLDGLNVSIEVGPGTALAYSATGASVSVSQVPEPSSLLFAGSALVCGIKQPDMCASITTAWSVR
jgi:hypothetical protein